MPIVRSVRNPAGLLLVKLKQIFTNVSKNQRQIYFSILLNTTLYYPCSFEL